MSNAVAAISARSPISSGELKAKGDWYFTIMAFRALWAAFFIFGFNIVVPLGTSPWLVALMAAVGVMTTSRLARSNLNWVGYLLFLATLWFLEWGFFFLGDLTLSSFFPSFFTTDVYRLHAGACLIAFTVAGLSTWVFWRVKIAITLEAIALSALCIIVFAGHRDYHLDRPKIINTLAWQLRVDHLSMLIFIGSALLVASTLYLYLASQAVRPRIDSRQVGRSSSGSNWAVGVFVLAIVSAILYAVQAALYSHFNAAMLARVANGVGMNSENGVSPLSFQSALGSTNQPAALVRLEGDYAYNPFTPMMYLREAALSAFNGKEMVNAGKAYDIDLPGTSPTESFTGKEDAELLERTPLVQSVYLLADHQNAFAVDYPLSIVQLKNPKPNRFKNAYRAYSSAPGYKLSDLVDGQVGDPRWSTEVREHFLKTHPDPRYRELAEKITEGADTPIGKVLAVTNYLSRTAIYTLTPNHDVKPDEDQVAPFLFGDNRGYCVHFAHAIVYMARSLGIPARIGTGYLTDLSQSKDGHILLLMSDRHAWAEIYIVGRGWVPFDIQPDHVESHADNKVDPKMLEDLMGMLDPGEEILPTDIAKNEPGMTDPGEPWVPSKSLLVTLFSSVVIVMVICKFFLLSGWKLFSSRRLKLRWAYFSAAARLTEIGVNRRYGETRSEFACRAPDGSLTALANLLLLHAYSSSPSAAIANSEIASAVGKVKQTIEKLSWWKRVWVVISPVSVVKFFGGSRW